MREFLRRYSLLLIICGGVVASAVAQVLTQQDVIKLLELKIPEQTIIEKVQSSGTAFVLGAEDIGRLKKAGASDALIAAMQSSAAGAGSPTSEITDLALIVDYSGSMNAKMKDGATKVASAKKCVNDLIEKLPNDLNVALIVYGVSKQRGCEDIDIVQPLGPIDKAGLKNKINGFNATGMTPIASSLTKAGEELKKAKGGSAIVLVTDGAESCHGDPAGVAAKLAAEFGVKFGINVIGFGIEPQEKAQLADIAAKGHGKLLTVENASELTDALKKVVEEKVKAPPPPAQRETTQYEAAGKAVQPGAFFNDAPVVQAGEFKGKLAFKEAHFYKVPLRKGQELRAIAMVQKTPLQSKLDPLDAPIRQDFVVTIYDSNLAPVAREVAKTEDNPTSPVTLRTTWAAESDGMAYVSIGSSKNYDNWGREDAEPDNKNPAPSPYTLKLRVEGEAAGQGTIEEPKTLDVKAGSNYATAGTIPGLGIVIGDIKFGESAFYSVAVKKGDVLNVAVTAQKPWEPGKNNSLRQQPNGLYNVVIYDDDQVEVAKQKFDIEENPPDAKGASVSWPVALSGRAYIAVSLTKAGNNHDDPKNPPGPGRIAVQVTTEGSTEAPESTETQKPAGVEKPTESPNPSATKAPTDPFAGAESTPG
jgi:hypothetical protein